jgi:hypothetical protein
MTKHSHKGFSLFEVFLVVTVFASVTIVAMQLFDDYLQKKKAQNIASQFEIIHSGITEILSNPTIFIEIHDNLLAGGNIATVTINDIIDGTSIFPVSSGLLNQNISNQIGAWKSPLSIILKVADDPADLKDIPAIEVLLVTNNRVEYLSSRKVAQFTKHHGGYYTNTDPAVPANSVIRSASSTWEFPINRFSGTVWHGLALSNAPSPNQGIYFAYYDYYNLDDIAGDYLHKDVVAGRPEFNRLHSDLDLNNNNILGVDDLDTQNLNIKGNTFINGSFQSNSVEINEGNFETDSTFETQNAVVRGLGKGSTGFLSNQGIIDTVNTDLSILTSNTTNFADLTIIDDVSANNVTASQNISSDSLFTSILDTSAFQPTLTTPQLRTSNIKTKGLSVTGNVGTNYMNIDGSLKQSGGGNLSVDYVYIDDLTTNTFGACDNGC